MHTSTLTAQTVETSLLAIEAAPEQPNVQAATYGTPVTPSEHVARLVADGLDQADDPNVPTSAVVRKALRVARFRDDWTAMLRFDMELRSTGNEEAKREIATKVAAHFTRDALTETWNRVVEEHINLRRIPHPLEPNEEAVAEGGIGEIEARVAGYREQASRLADAADGAPESEVEEMRSGLLLAAHSQEVVLARVRQRAAAYLGTAEQEIMSGQVRADVFERNREWVNGQLEAKAPRVLEQLDAAYRRRDEGDAESRVHALTSCRRVLSTLADALYPASKGTATGVDGRERKMNQEAYINRLLQFASEAQMGSRSRELLTTQIKLLGERLAALNGLASKGVHADVSREEVDQCLIQTYLAAGDLLRLAADDSGAQQSETKDASNPSATRTN